MIKKLLYTVLLAAVAGCAAGQGGRLPASAPEVLDDTLIQISTIGALKKGVYDGAITTEELGQWADHGLGAYEHLNGEMLLVDGVFYRVDVSGRVEADRQGSLPYASVTRFAPDYSFILENVKDYKDLQARIRENLEYPTMFYALRVTGTFDTVKARSVPGQSKPYPPLLDVIKEQAVFHFDDIHGQAIGFWRPDMAPELWPGGFHLHFLSTDKTRGGHLLDAAAGSVTVEVDETCTHSVTLPWNANFQGAGLADEAAGHKY